MANVLGALFSDIAKSIRGGLGDIDKMAPTAFPDKIDEIVALLNNAGTGGGSGNGGSVSQKNTRHKQGTFTTSSTDLGRRYITHELGETPDFAAVFLDKATGDIKAENSPIIFLCGFRKNMMSGASLYGMSCFLDRANFSSIGADSLIGNESVENFSSRVYFDSTRIRVGTDFDDYGEQFLPNSTYRWVAYTGLGSVVTGSSADIRYVTFKDDTGAVEYGKKAVAVGDDCADPIARGIFSTPTKASTDQYNYTFAGWATTPSGGIDSNALKAVNEDRTVYANFISAVRYYTITYYDSDGVSVLKTESLAYGTMPSYIPEKDGYQFNGWIPALSAVTGSASYTAQFIESVELQAASWETIAAKSADGTASQTWKVGDTKDVPVTLDDGTTGNITVIIAGFNHDNLANGSGKAGISFVCKPEPTLKSRMTNYAYPNTTLRSYLNTTMFSKLPVELQNVIKPVLKAYDEQSSSGSFYIKNSSDSLWPLSLTEIGETGKVASGVTATLGNKYDLFSEQSIGTSGTSNFPILTYSNGNAINARFWLRSFRKVGSFSYFYVYVSEDGRGNKVATVSDTVPSNTDSFNHPVVFGFCI